MNNEPKLDLDKPMQTRDGRKVVDFHVFENRYYRPLLCMLEGEAEFFSYNIDGRFYEEKENGLDLINVPEPEPVQFWDCPEDVPKRDVIWLRHKVLYKSGCKRLLIGVDEKALEIDCMSINYEQLRDWQWLDNGEWKECVKG